MMLLLRRDQYDLNFLKIKYECKSLVYVPKGRYECYNFINVSTER